VITLGAIVAVPAVVAIVLGIRRLTVEDPAQRRDDIRAAATQEATNLLAADYRKAQQVSDQILSGATGQFRDDWAGTGGKAFVDAITKAQSVGAVQTVVVGVVSADTKSAEVMVAANSTVTMPQVPSGTLRTARWSMNLDKVGGRWLVSKMALVP
jgi:Mce-associated membrane protein